MTPAATLKVMLPVEQELFMEPSSTAGAICSLGFALERPGIKTLAHQGPGGSQQAPRHSTALYCTGIRQSVPAAIDSIFSHS